MRTSPSETGRPGRGSGSTRWRCSALALGVAARALGAAGGRAAIGRSRLGVRGPPLSTWLAAGADPAEVAQRAGNSVEVLLNRYAKCLYDRQSINNQRIEGLLNAYDVQALPGITAVDGKGDG
jgi:hypothetical protein